MVLERPYYYDALALFCVSESTQAHQPVVVESAVRTPAKMVFKQPKTLAKCLK